MEAGSRDKAQAAQLNNRIQGLGREAAKSQRKKTEMLGSSDAVIVTRVQVKAGVGSGPRVVSSAPPAPSARDAMPRFGLSRHTEKGAPH